MRTPIAMGPDIQLDDLIIKAEYADFLDITGLNPERPNFETVYSPLVDAIHERGLIRWFPDQTVTDMFIWIMEYRRLLENEVGWSIGPDAAVSSLVVNTSLKAIRSDREPEVGAKHISWIAIQRACSPKCWCRSAEKGTAGEHWSKRSSLGRETAQGCRVCMS